MIILFEIILFLLPISQIFGDCYVEKVIIVQNTTQLTDECGKVNGTLYCQTLDDALSNYYHYFKSSSNICINILEDQTLRYPYSLYELSNFTLTAPESSYISVECKKNIKLSITDSSSVLIENIIFLSCGGYSTQDVFPQPKASLVLSSAIYFRNTTNISILSSIFELSVGYSIIFVDCYKKIVLDGVTFANNQLSKHQSEKFSYGGGVIITYSSTAVQKKNNYQISNCLFESLVAIDEPNNEGLFQVWSPYGNGGGLTLILKSYSFVTMEVNHNTKFSNNRALWGAGFYALITGTTQNTTVKFNITKFSKNNATYSGGAIRVVKRNFTYNEIYVWYSDFSLNVAEIGGALSQIFNQYDTSMHKSHEFFIIGSSFYKNSAKLGSAIYFENTNALIFGGEIKKNSIKQSPNASSSSFGKLSTVSGVGAVYIYKGKLILGNSKTDKLLAIEENFNTAFVLEHSDIWFMGGAIFKQNRGSYGGALALYEHSRIILTNQTNVLFLENAANKGGAIYVHLSGPPLPLWDSPELLLYSCFIKFRFGQSKDFHGKMNFSNNKAVQENGNSIFATTIQNCVESKNDDISNIITNWTGFYFSNPGNAISTDPVLISISDDEWSKISPGIVFNPTVQLFDERNNSISGPIDITLNSTHVRMLDKSSRKIVYDETIDLTLVSDQYHGSNFSIVLNSPSGRPIPEDVSNELYICPFGYTYTSQLNKCVCFNKKNQDRMISKCIGKDIYLYNNVWAAENQPEAYDDNEKTIVCPPGYCNICNNTEDGYPSIDCKYNPENQCAKTRDQNSNLCGGCLKGWAVEFGSEHCSDKCHNATGKYWIPFAIFFAIAIIVYFILVLNLDVYDDFFSVTLFFYQTVDILFTPTQQIMARDDAMKFVIGVLQLNGIHLGHTSVGVCFSETFDDADKLMFNYVLPFSMIVSLLMFIWLSNSRYNIIRFPLSRVTSFRAFIFIMFLAYADFIRLTFNLLQPVTIRQGKYFRYNAELPYFEGKHLFYGLFAIFILIFVVIGFPLMLLLSSLDINVPWLSRHLLPLKESFDFCFKKKWYYQMFSVYYFLARIILLAVNTQPKTQLQASILGIISFLLLIILANSQPYTSKIYSLFDIAVLFCFTLVAFCSNGKLKLLVHDSNDQRLATIIQVIVWIPLVLWLLAFLARRIMNQWKLIKKFFVTAFDWVRSAFCQPENP